VANCRTRLTEALEIDDTFDTASNAVALEQTTEYLVLLTLYFAVLSPEHMLVIKLCRMVACFTARDR